MISECIYFLTFATSIAAKCLDAGENFGHSLTHDSDNLFTIGYGSSTTETTSYHDIGLNELGKRNGPGLGLNLTASWYFACPRTREEEQLSFKLRAQYNALSSLVTYVPLEGIDYFVPNGQRSWNPIMYKASYHRRLCRRISRHTTCYYDFTGHFYGQVYPSHMNIYMVTTNGQWLSPLAEEYCVRANSLPTANTPRVSCIVQNVAVLVTR